MEKGLMHIVKISYFHHKRVILQWAATCSGSNAGRCMPTQPAPKHRWFKTGFATSPWRGAQHTSLWILLQHPQAGISPPKSESTDGKAACSREGYAFPHPCMQEADGAREPGQILQRRLSFLLPKLESQKTRQTFAPSPSLRLPPCRQRLPVSTRSSQTHPAPAHREDG